MGCSCRTTPVRYRGPLGASARLSAGKCPPRRGQGRDGRYGGRSEKKSVHLESPPTPQVLDATSWAELRPRKVIRRWRRLARNRTARVMATATSPGVLPSPARSRGWRGRGCRRRCRRNLIPGRRCPAARLEEAACLLVAAKQLHTHSHRNESSELPGLPVGSCFAFVITLNGLI
jgi:hypothetical protein